jgi:2Fe-2S ferredoxin
MRGAVDNGISGIDGDCDGACACATCHIYVEPEWRDKVGPRQEREEEMLSFAATTKPESRLACQITMAAALDGLTVKMPERQH